MGACLGKKSHKMDKYAPVATLRRRSRSFADHPPPLPTVEETSEPSELQDVDQENLETIAELDTEFQVLLEATQQIEQTFLRSIPQKFISVTNSELENELANIINENSQIDCNESAKSDTNPSKSM